MYLIPIFKSHGKDEPSKTLFCGMDVSRLNKIGMAKYETI